MSKLVSFNDKIVEQVENLQTSYTFSEFCQMAVREVLNRKEEVSKNVSTGKDNEQNDR